MSGAQMSEFVKESKNFIKNPIGMIGLFIVSVYAIASLAVIKINPSDFASNSIIAFMVIFPVLVLFMFYRIVTKYPAALYGPADYKDETILRDLQMTLLASNNPDDLKFTEKSKQKKLESVSQRLTVLREQLNWQNAGRILWVDDNPSNNLALMRQFENFGLSIDIAKNTNDATTLFKSNRYLLIISDMGRAEGNREGYVLLSKIRNQDNYIPFFIFSSSDNPEHHLEAIKSGGNGSTNSSMRLTEWVFTEAIKKVIWGEF